MHDRENIGQRVDTVVRARAQRGARGCGEALERAVCVHSAAAGLAAS